MPCPDSKARRLSVYEPTDSRDDGTSNGKDTSRFELEVMKALYEKKLCLRQKLEEELAALAAIVPPQHRHPSNKSTGRKRTLADLDSGPDDLPAGLDVEKLFDEAFSNEVGLEGFRKQLSVLSCDYRLKRTARISPPDPLVLSSKIISCVESSPTKDMFASGGVQKRVHLHRLQEAANDSPALLLQTIEMASKISCLSWSRKLPTQLFSADYEGAVHLIDSAKGSIAITWLEHEKRAWTVDCSVLDPHRIASGSDDCKVKLWTPGSRKSVLTLDLRANACTVKFSPANANILAAGAADHRIYIFDIRKPTLPIASLKQHSKAVSYVRFDTSGSSLFSSSTDSSIRRWRLQDLCGASWLPDAVYSGHQNEKNFTGLSIVDGFVACGSETNTVHVYHRDLPCPLAQYTVPNECPLTGVTLDHEPGSFISSVCWSDPTRLLVANSSGVIEILSFGPIK